MGMTREPSSTACGVSVTRLLRSTVADAHGFDGHSAQNVGRNRRRRGSAAPCDTLGFGGYVDVADRSRGTGDRRERHEPGAGASARGRIRQLSRHHDIAGARDGAWPARHLRRRVVGSV